jgi:hypothetical protein
MRLDWLAQLLVGHIPFKNATSPFLNGKPAHVGAAYSLAVPVAVKR